MEKIIVTPRSLSDPPHPLLERLQEAGYEVVFPSPGKRPEPAEVEPHIGEAVGYLAGVEPIPASLLERAGKLRAISRNGTGVDNVDVAAAERLGIPVLKAAGANARGVAELTIAHLFAAARDIAQHARWMRDGEWKRIKGFELAGRTLGLIGCGKIGQMVAGLALGIGMKVHAYDPYPDLSFDPGGDFAFASLDDVLVTSDVVSLHAALAPGDPPVLDRKRIAALRHGAVVINTARYELIDADAMREALDSGRVACLTLDAYPEEPPADRRLVDHDSVIATPHIGGFTGESVDRATEAAVENLLEALGGGG